METLEMLPEDVGGYLDETMRDILSILGLELDPSSYSSFFSATIMELERLIIGARLTKEKFTMIRSKILDNLHVLTVTLLKLFLRSIHSPDNDLILSDKQFHEQIDWDTLIDTDPQREWILFDAPLFSELVFPLSKEGALLSYSEGLDLLSLVSPQFIPLVLSAKERQTPLNFRNPLSPEFVGIKINGLALADGLKLKVYKKEVYMQTIFHEMGRRVDIDKIKDITGSSLIHLSQTFDQTILLTKVAIKSPIVHDSRKCELTAYFGDSLAFPSTKYTAFPLGHGFLVLGNDPIRCPNSKLTARIDEILRRTNGGYLHFSLETHGVSLKLPYVIQKSYFLLSPPLIHFRTVMLALNSPVKLTVFHGKTMITLSGSLSLRDSDTGQQWQTYFGFDDDAIETYSIEMGMTDPLKYYWKRMILEFKHDAVEVLTP